MERRPNPAHIPIRRASALHRCLKWRAMIKEGDRVVNDTLYTVEFMTQMLRRDQVMLLRLRIWRSTGEYPAEH